MPISPHRYTFSRLLAAALGAIGFACCSQAEQSPGFAAVTTVRGNAQISSTDDTQRLPKLHEIIGINACSIQTQAESELVLSLSNGIGLSISESSSVAVERYTQAPFEKRKEGLQFEPSSSTLTLKLDTGSLGLAYEHLSPLSTATVQLPLGDLKVHSSTIAVHVKDNQHCTIYVVFGTATLHASNSTERTFLSSGQQLIIEGSTTHFKDLSDAPEASLRLAHSADYSRKRVLFRNDETEERPKAIWVSPVEQLEKETKRPYSFEL